MQTSIDLPPRPSLRLDRGLIVPERRIRPVRRCRVPIRAAYGTLQRDKTSGALKRSKTRGGVRRNAWQPDNNCCCQPGSGSGGCPCASSGGGMLHSTLRATLSGWVICGPGVCAQHAFPFVPGTGNPTAYTSSLTLDGTYCCQYVNTTVGTCQQAESGSLVPFTCTWCTYAALLATAGTTVYYPNGGGACTGGAVTVTGAYLILTVYPNAVWNDVFAMNTPFVQADISVAAKSDGTLWKPSESQDLIAYEPFGGFGNNSGWLNIDAQFDGSCGFTASYSNGKTCADFPSNNRSFLLPGAITVTDTTC